MFRIGKNTGRTGLVLAVPANTGCTGRYLNTRPKHKNACFVNFDIFKGKIVILLNPNSKTLALPNSHTALFLSFFLSHALSQLLCSLSLSANLSLTLSTAPLLCLSPSAALSLTCRRCSVSHSVTRRRYSVSHSPSLLCLSAFAALSFSLRCSVSHSLGHSQVTFCLNFFCVELYFMWNMINKNLITVFMNW